VDLQDLRNRIDHLDDELLNVLNERMELVKKVGDLKRSSQSIIYRPEREKQILDRLEKRNNGLLTTAGD
jgi:chorismate mutase/prephenate dehydratase